ncbi:AMP-binding protein [Acidisphaera rubrifaciens]|uniref:AMP-dependent synthetase and ligase n=1 Tax=Acidisphaera rubrifaciens HS-AP3 TaxID=1231350 RepID=A0A0D6PA07_9PROT|nr:AMP-binding protein [Acidisphaera rubrifaciens]GAN78502.1 AMP-dependent synthetase and ligase [Acidisphaera rubrifaciens HS-AP3]
MLDLGRSFLGSVARDPAALAIVDGEVRLTYAAWLRHVSAVVAGLDDLGLRPGDHLLTLLQNRWEAATLYWACQLAGIIITPLNWRATADEVDYVATDAGARAVVYEQASADALAASACARSLPRVVIGDAAPPGAC